MKMWFLSGMKSVWKLVLIYECMQEKHHQRNIIQKGEFLRQMKKWQMELCIYSVDFTWCNSFSEGSYFSSVEYLPGTYILVLKQK